jgi:hypothetical protein
MEANVNIWLYWGGRGHGMMCVAQVRDHLLALVNAAINGAVL